MTKGNQSKVPLNVAIAGFGTVGQSVARILCEGSHDSLRLSQICNRGVERKHVNWVPPDVFWTDQIDDVLASNADVLVELIGGLDPATDWIRRALKAGKSVVTANKQVIAHYGPTLLDLAQQHHCRLCFEAAVAGGIPVIRTLQEGLAGDSLFRIMGILNGTCNYILTRMEANKIPFTSALGEAQQLGYAEADPTADVEGLDSQAKLAILAAVSLRCQVDVDTIPLRTITAVDPIDFVYAKRLDCTIRQVARAELDMSISNRILASVQPVLVPHSSMLARVEGSRNVVVVEGKFGGETAFSGYGAGGNPTAVSVVSDLESIARRDSDSTISLPRIGPTAEVEHEIVAPYYVRFIVSDRPGIIAALADVFSKYAINVDSVLQEPGWPKSELPFVVILDPSSSTDVTEAVREIESFDFHVRPPVSMPIMLDTESPS